MHILKIGEFKDVPAAKFTCLKCNTEFIANITDLMTRQIKDGYDVSDCREYPVYTTKHYVPCPLCCKLNPIPNETVSEMMKCSRYFL